MTTDEYLAQCKKEMLEDESNKIISAGIITKEEAMQKLAFRYPYNVPRQAITILRDTMMKGKVKHPKNDGWKRSTGYHVWRAMKHLLWYVLTWKIYHLEHAFTRLMMALGVRNGWK